MTDKTPTMPELPEPSGVIVVGTQALRAFTADQMRAYALAALQSAQPAAPSCVFGAVPLRPGDTLGPQTAACLTCGQPPACLSHPAESDRQQGLSITGEQPAAVSDEELQAIDDAHNWQTTAGRHAAYRAILALRPQADHPDTARCIKARNDLNAALHGEGALIDALEHAVANACAKLLRPQAVPMTDEQRREDFMAGYAAAEQDATVCQVPPFGWRCAREAGHEGPCAAVETDDAELVQRGMARLRRALAQRPAAQAGEREAFESRVTLNSIIKQYRIKAEDAHWLRASLPAPQQATPEPVGEVKAIARVPSGVPGFMTDVLGVALDQAKVKVGDKLYTRPAPGVPEGFALVPVEPTPEMLKAMESQWLVGSQVDMAKREYAAMLTAAQAKGADK